MHIGEDRGGLAAPLIHYDEASRLTGQAVSRAVRSTHSLCRVCSHALFRRFCGRVRPQPWPRASNRRPYGAIVAWRLAAWWVRIVITSRVIAPSSSLS
jgi:hypothetical protein